MGKLEAISRENAVMAWWELSTLSIIWWPKILDHIDGFPWAQMSQGTESRTPAKAEPQSGLTGDDRDLIDYAGERVVIALYRLVSDNCGTWSREGWNKQVVKESVTVRNQIMLQFPQPNTLVQFWPRHACRAADREARNRRHQGTREEAGNQHRCFVAPRAPVRPATTLRALPMQKLL